MPKIELEATLVVATYITYYTITYKETKMYVPKTQLNQYYENQIRPVLKNNVWKNNY